MAANAIRTQYPSAGRSKTTQICSFTLPFAIAFQVERHAHAQEISKSRLVTQALTDYFANKKPQETS